MQSALTPDGALATLTEGNKRFVSGRRLLTSRTSPYLGNIPRKRGNHSPRFFPAPIREYPSNSSSIRVSDTFL